MSDELENRLWQKKPVVIEAMQLTDANKTDVAEWCLKGMVLAKSATEYVTGNPIMTIDTLEGRMYASEGDWIIRGVQGEFYPCKPDIFEATYQKPDAVSLPARPQEPGQTIAEKFDAVIALAEECFAEFECKSPQNGAPGYPHCAACCGGTGIEAVCQEEFDFATALHDLAAAGWRYKNATGPDGPTPLSEKLSAPSGPLGDEPRENENPAVQGDWVSRAEVIEALALAVDVFQRTRQKAIERGDHGEAMNLALLVVGIIKASDIVRFLAAPVLGGDE